MTPTGMTPTGMTPTERIQSHLRFLYGDEAATRMLPAFESSMQRTRAALAVRTPPPPLDERDALLITYGDSVQSVDEAPLRTLRRFMQEELADVVNGVHILPFYPYTSDDGFSVVDYRAIDPNLGDWEDIEALTGEARVMFDAVINHISQSSAWFQAFLRGEAPYTDYFISADPNWDLREVVRPRTLPLLTPFSTTNPPTETTEGGQTTRHVWTTFSADQIDLNYANPQVALEIADLLLFYAERGANLIRLDAIAYMWKEPGTRSIHMPQTHAIIKLLRAVLDGAAPHVLLITETNVPHADNISYFGALLSESVSDSEADSEAGSEAETLPRSDEAQLVYQFPLAPLILHSLASGDASILTRWAGELGNVPGSFFNFTASHDGIGVLPALGYLSSEQVTALAERTLAHGGRISYRSLPDGSQTPYELNITFYDALNNPDTPAPAVDSARFLASQAIMLALAGLPGIYFQSLFGARNCARCLQETGRARSINREKFDFDTLLTLLHDQDSREYAVYQGYRRLLRARAGHPAFHPAAPQRILALDAAVFAVLRHLPGWLRGNTEGDVQEDNRAVLCVINVTAEERVLSIALEAGAPAQWIDMLDSVAYTLQDGALRIVLAPYQVLWLASAVAEPIANDASSL